MTHDELLAKIKREEDYLKTYAEGYGFVVTNTLRAVVELCNFLDKKGRCCVPVTEVIQAIEKELK